jgi:uncharacterized protein (UPF0179 family)
MSREGAEFRWQTRTECKNAASCIKPRHGGRRLKIERIRSHSEVVVVEEGGDCPLRDAGQQIHGENRRNGTMIARISVLP